MPRINAAARGQLLDHLHDLVQTNHDIDNLIFGHLHLQSVAGQLDRRWFNHLPHEVAREVMASWLRAHNIRSFDSRTIERLVVAAKVSAPGKLHPVIDHCYLEVGVDTLALRVAER